MAYFTSIEITAHTNNNYPEETLVIKHIEGWVVPKDKPGMPVQLILEMNSGHDKKLFFTDDHERETFLRTLHQRIAAGS